MVDIPISNTGSSSYRIVPGTCRAGQYRHRHAPVALTQLQATRNDHR
jgi:hypothetical protein